MKAPLRIYHHCAKSACDHALLTDPPEFADQFEIVQVSEPVKNMRIQVNSNCGWSGWDVIEPPFAKIESGVVQDDGTS